MSLRRPVSNTVYAFQYNEIDHFCLYPSLSWVFPLNRLHLFLVLYLLIVCMPDNLR